MELRVEFGAYNQRRFSKPFIMVCKDWKIGKNPEWNWGAYIGNDMGGYVSADVIANDIVRYGKKDSVQLKNNNYGWYKVVVIDGKATLEEVEVTKARDIFLSREVK
jgi:hypothetical protein